jgi:8-oxo-dGTP diphosphatase
MDHDNDNADSGDASPVRLAAAIAVHSDRVLIVRRSIREGFLPGVWGLPCGKVDQGESVEEAVLRELREETGLDGEVVRKVGTCFFDSDWHGQRVRNEQSNFLIRPKDPSESAPAGEPPEVKLPETDQRYEWVPAGKIENVGLDDHNLDAIRQGLRDKTLFQSASASSVGPTSFR